MNMKISRTTGYALIAVGFIAQNYKEGEVLAARISKEYNIPLEYLLKILQQLVRANILRSKRGPRGGFILAHPAKEISMLEIIEAVDGPLKGHLHLAELAGKQAFATRMEEVCGKAADEAIAIFDKAKIKGTGNTGPRITK
jgi:Rrf2 family protein